LKIIKLQTYLLLGLEEIHGSASRHEQAGLKLELTLNAEVLHSEVLFPVI
jgi:hypothetical protein